MRRAPCALYHRVSTVDQHPEAALPSLRKAALARGYRVEVEEREAVSTRRERPGLRRVLEAAQRGDVAAVLVWKLDRFGRSALELLTHVQQLRQAGVRFIVTTQPIDVGPDSDPTGNAYLTMLAAFAELERTFISERTRQGIAHARREGRRLGRPPSDVDGRMVAELRHVDASWPEVGLALGCAPSTARDAHQRFLEGRV